MTEEELARAIYRALDDNSEILAPSASIDALDEEGKVDLSCVWVNGTLDLIALARFVMDIVGKETKP